MHVLLSNSQAGPGRNFSQPHMSLFRGLFTCKTFPKCPYERTNNSASMSRLFSAYGTYPTLNNDQSGDFPSCPCVPSSAPLFPFPASTSEDTPPFAAPSPSLPLCIRPVIRYDVRRSRMARSAHSHSLRLFRKPCCSPSTGGREAASSEIPQRLRAVYLRYSVASECYTFNILRRKCYCK